ncbi:MAG: histidine kinase [Bacteroidales bacterium]|nr:histidine kinase [Bacteroidales bacterium]
MQSVNIKNFDFNKYRIIWHILFWLLYLILHAFSSNIYYEDSNIYKILAKYSISIPIDILAAYFTAYYLLPKFLLKGKYIHFMVIFFLSAIFFIFFQRALMFYISYPIFYSESYQNIKFFKINYIFSFFNIYAIVGIFASIKLLKYWFKNQQTTRLLEKEKLEAELKFLKSQIHPHFLFNTLNNLYALTLDKSDLAPEVVIKLSDLLDYMLYECNTPKVSLDKEIKLINDYLSLEKIRYRKELIINFDISGKTSGKQIAPMLLLPFIENSFKHGLSKKKNNPWINITLVTKNEALHFNVKNNKAISKIMKKEEYTEGIGLKNVRRRLDLLYEGAYKLELMDNDDSFEINLEINL